MLRSNRRTLDTTSTTGCSLCMRLTPHLTRRHQRRPFSLRAGPSRPVQRVSRFDPTRGRFLPGAAGVAAEALPLPPRAVTPTIPTILSKSSHSLASAIQEEERLIDQFDMTATKIDGTAIAKSIRERLHKEIEDTQKTNPRYKPSLKIIQGKTHSLLWPVELS